MRTSQQTLREILELKLRRPLGERQPINHHVSMVRSGSGNNGGISSVCSLKERACLVTPKTYIGRDKPRLRVDTHGGLEEAERAPSIFFPQAELSDDQGKERRQNEQQHHIRMTGSIGSRV